MGSIGLDGGAPALVRQACTEAHLLQFARLLSEPHSSEVRITPIGAVITQAGLIEHFKCLPMQMHIQVPPSGPSRTPSWCVGAGLSGGGRLGRAGVPVRGARQPLSGRPLGAHRAGVQR